MTLVANGSRPVSRTTSAITDFQAELDGFKTIMRTFQKMSVEEVLITISSIHARLVEIRALLVRQEPDTRCAYLRTKEVDPLLEAADFQFRCWSRIIHVRTSEYNMAGA